jgi:hypothetical protein
VKVPTSDWAPSVKDIGGVLRARTKDRSQNELGTFTSDTRPTDVEVEVLINKAVGDVAMRTGSELPEAVWEDAKGVAATRTAMLVELGFFPEQVNRGNSPYPQLETMWKQDIADLVKAVTAAGGDTPEPGAPLKPTYAFPMNGDSLIIGRATRW